MTKLIQSLREEITRVAKRTVSAEIASLRQASSTHRSAIAALNRKNAELRREVARLKKSLASTKPVAKEEETKLRFRADGFASRRKRLGLSAESFGKLHGVSGATVHAWEAGTTPRAKYLPIIAALRKLTKRQAEEMLSR